VKLHSSVGVAAMAVAAVLVMTPGGPVLAAEPAAKADIKDKTVYLAPGSWLRYTDRLISRVYTTTKVTLQIKGRGVCTKRLCPVTHNGVELWAIRGRLDDTKPATGTVVTERTLRLGDDGSDVKLVQDALTKAGYKVKADGKFGHDTQKAVEDLQKKNKIDVDGEIGPQTRIALKI